MKKYRIKWMAYCLLASTFTLSSCDDSDGPASVVQSFEPITVDESSLTPITVTEGGEHTFSFSFSESQIMEVHVNVEHTAASTATTLESSPTGDFASISENIAVPVRGTASVSFSVEPDYHVEGDETIVLSISGDDGDPVPVTGGVETVAVIKDSVYTDAAGAAQKGLLLDMRGTFVFGGTTYLWTGFGIDVDLAVFESGFVPTDGDAFYGNDLSGFAASTGSFQETIFAGSMPSTDGTYDLYAYLYGLNPVLAQVGLTADIPLSLSILESGKEEFMTTIAGYNPVNTPVGSIIFMGQIEKAGNVITLKDPAGNVVGTVGN